MVKCGSLLSPLGGEPWRPIHGHEKCVCGDVQSLFKVVYGVKRGCTPENGVAEIQGPRCVVAKESKGGLKHACVRFYAIVWLQLQLQFHAHRCRIMGPGLTGTSSSMRARDMADR